MNKSQRVSVADAARELGCSPASVREHMRWKIWHIGVATPPEKTGKKTWEFAIYRAMLDKHLGIDRNKFEGR